MVRSKAVAVQRKRPHGDSADSSDPSSHPHEAHESNALNGNDSATESDENAAKGDDDSGTGDRPHKRVAREALPASPGTEAPAESPTLALSFRAAWTPARRKHALELSWSPTPRVYALLAAALQGLSGWPIGLEVVGGAGLAVRDEDGAVIVATALTLDDLFPGLDREGQGHLLRLVEQELLLLEVVMHPRASAARTEFVLRASVAWREYSAVPRPARRLEFPRTQHRHRHRTAACLSMHQAMLWLLVTVRDADREQCAFGYWREVDALFADAFGPEPPQAAKAFDIHDVYARIDVQRQLRRDTSNYRDAAAAAAGGTALVPTLRPYQEAAVSWMLSRETGAGLVRAELPMLVRFPQHHAALGYDPFRARFYDAAAGENDSDSENGSDSEDDSESDDPFFPAGPASDLSAVRGGILADEMGLGKTVEVIALVLSHPWPGSAPVRVSQHRPPAPAAARTHAASRQHGCICGSDADDAHGGLQCAWCPRWHHRLCTGNDASAAATAPPFMCFHCQPAWRPELACKTTLIVSPEAISDQWERELARHVQPGALKVLRYPGVRALHRRLAQWGRPSSDWQVLADAGRFLASFDVILTTYEVLGADLHHIPSAATLARRASTRQRSTKYAFLASPLLFLRFWRVCMDEAQVGVENTQLRAALTVAELHAELKWVVTGTPFSTQLGDLYGGLKFLRVAPFDEDAAGAAVFANVLERGFALGACKRLLDLLLWDGHSAGGRHRHRGGGLLWRTGKRDVRQQLGLPAQTTEVVWCRLSEVERHFYDEKEKAIIAKVNEFQRRRGAAGVTDAIWPDLLVLRQICCHPQIGSALAGSALSLRSVGRTAGSSGSGVLSMDAFLRGLIVKCRRKCEEAQRKLLAAHNALAGMDLIDDQRLAAMAKYLASLQLIERHWPLFRADMLPRVHILVNLARCARAVFGVPASDENDAEAAAAMSALATADDNAKEHSLLPDVSALARAVDLNASEDAARAGADVADVARDCDALDASAHRIRRFYLNQAEVSHDAALGAFQVATAAVDADVRASRAKRPVLCSASLWWLAALAALERHDAEQAAGLVTRLRARLLALDTLWARQLCSKFSSLAGFRVAFLAELEELATTRAALCAKVTTLSAATLSTPDVALSGNCARCRDGGRGPTCAQCKLDNELHAYWQHLRGHLTSATAKSAGWTATATTSRRGDAARNAADDLDAAGDVDAAVGGRTLATSPVMELFREIAATPRAASADTDPNAPTPQDGLRDEHEFWGRVQKEWAAASKLVQVQRQRLGALDELAMATTLVRLQHDGEVVTSATDKGYKLLRSALPMKRLAAKGDYVTAELELHDKMAQLRYLEQLEQRKQQQAGAAAASQDATADARDAAASKCVVCLNELANERVMLPCAHVFCKGCVQKLVKARAASGTVSCPLCRVQCSATKATVVFEDAERAAAKLAARRHASTRPVADAHVILQRGGFGSKVDAVVRRVHALALENACVKCLLFTQWGDMVHLISSCLALNGVVCFEYRTGKSFAREVQDFKECTRPCVLALPFKVGANGLNLVEATEVLLVEPLLNTSIEAQAINRVHRIGQTKATRVHRFVVDNSVEERIFWLGQKNATRGTVARQRRERAVVGDGDDKENNADNDSDSDNDNGDSDKENKADNDDNDTVERAPSKKEKEQLSLSELHLLLDGKLNDGARQSDTDATGNNDGDEEGERLHPFWDDQVLMNGRAVARLEAKQRIERRQAAERRAREQSAEPQGGAPPLTHLFELALNVAVAHEVVNLADASELEQTRAISTELLAFHRARLQEELELWRAAV